MKFFTRKRNATAAQADNSIEEHTDDTHMNEEKNNTTSNETRKDNIYNLIILDESGSMHRVYHAALDGANETINSVKGAQAKLPEQNHLLTFVTFDEGSKPENVRFIIDTKNIAEVSNLTESDYQPGGCTPLYDAIGISLTKLEGQVSENDNVLVTIITDGLENASKEYHGPQVKAMIDRLKAKGWTFVFMGANMDSGEVARTLSIDNSMDFRADDASYRGMSIRVNNSRQMYYEKVRMSKMRGEKFFADKDFFNEGLPHDRVTIEHITDLAPDEVFVFGSNILGHHDGGAAKQAVRHFGAVYGQASGPQGQSYAIVTVGVTLDTLRQQVDEFLSYAEQHQDKCFLVSRIGCGNAGWNAGQIAPFFERARTMQNVFLPEEFWRIIGR
jgi:hypothetical protein